MSDKKGGLGGPAGGPAHEVNSQQSGSASRTLHPAVFAFHFSPLKCCLLCSHKEGKLLRAKGTK